MMQIIELALKIADKQYQDKGFQQELDAVHKKIKKSQKEIQDALNFQSTNSQEFSSLFKGDPKLEVQIRELQQLKYNIDYIKGKKVFKLQKHLSNAKVLINRQILSLLNILFKKNLEIIRTQNEKYFLDLIDENDQLFQLNQGMDDISSLLILYFQGLFANQRAINWFDSHGEEILDYIYQIIKERAESVQNQLYKILLNKMDNLILPQHQSESLKHLCQKILERKTTIKDITQIIQQHFYELNKQLIIKSELLYGFQLTGAILSIHKKIFYDIHNKQIIECLQIYQNPLNGQENEFLQEYLELRFYDYLQTHKLIGGITEQEGNQSLQYLISSCDWLINESLTESVNHLLDTLSKYCYRVIQSHSSIHFKNQQYQSTASKLYQFSQQNLQRIIVAQKWWSQNLDEKARLRIIFQIYIIQAKFQFFDDQLSIGIYSPTDRLSLIQIFRVLCNNQSLSYYLQILNFCEIITQKIQIQIIQQVQEKLNIESNQIEILKVNISLQCENFQINIYQCEEINFWQRDLQFYNILQPISNDGVIDIKLAQLQYESLKPTLQQISKKIENIGDEPKLNFEVISKQATNSNVLTLFISGFLTENDNKGKDWMQLLQIGPGPGTVIAMHWNSLCLTDLLGFVGQLALQIDSKEDYFKTLMQTGAKCFSKNTYDYANEQAKKAGIYLGYLFSHHNLFGGSSTNIIVHSLGSVVLYYFIKTLDKLYEKSQKQFINDILLMGGVEDINKLGKLRWNSVAGRVFNISSQNDSVLRNILSLTQLDVKPCGLNKIPFIFKQIINVDMTYLINGHTDYKNKLKAIFWLLGFNNDDLQFKNKND